MDNSRKEVENYLPQKALEMYFGSGELKLLGQFDDLQQFLESHRLGEGKRFERNKVLFAQNVTQYMDFETLTTVLDLGEKLERAYNLIKKWNHID